MENVLIRMFVNNCKVSKIKSSLQANKRVFFPDAASVCFGMSETSVNISIITGSLTNKTDNKQLFLPNNY